MHTDSESIELLAPAGDLECARAAVENGADAIYFGLDTGFNARARATNISLATLPQLMTSLRGRGVRGYLTLNTLVFADELPQFEATMRQAANAGIDAVLIQDLGVARLVRRICPDIELHASTQMTITSAECLAAVESLGISRVVLARELSIAEIAQIRQRSELPLEAFAHGALCVAYSGQCMTSESLGGRSANRGQCAQACRLPYELVCDGEDVDLGDMKYLLSPQDLAAHALLPEMLAAGIASFKIEGRLKTPEYVANITNKYRRALDAAIAHREEQLTAQDIQEMELSFSRGFSPGWLQGCDHKMLVPALSSAKRGVLAGEVVEVKRDAVLVRPASIHTTGAPSTVELQPGDGVAFSESDASDDNMQGGRIYAVTPHDHGVALRFGRDLPLDQLRAGMQVWKTDDPQLMRRLRKSYANERPQYRLALDVHAVAVAGAPLQLSGQVFRGSRSLAKASVVAQQPLEAARKHVLTADVVEQQLRRLGGTAFALRELTCELAGEPMAPLSLLNQLRQELVSALQSELAKPPARSIQADALASMRREVAREGPEHAAAESPRLRVLCRTLHQLDATLAAGCRDVIVDFQDIRQFREAVQRAAADDAECWLATPRIQKPGEIGVFRAMCKHQPTGVLVRNLAGLNFFRNETRVACDFSLNAANELTAAWLREQGAERVTASYDLNRDQLTALLEQCPPQWLEIVIHQHMPMFHMEHCVFCSVLSPGTDKTNCGRPCDDHQVRLRDRVGKEHRLHADVGCRNTLYNATPQSGAELAPTLLSMGVRDFRIELLDDQPSREVQAMLDLYRNLLSGKISGATVWQTLQASNRVGVTRGTYEEKRNPLAIL